MYLSLIHILTDITDRKNPVPFRERLSIVRSLSLIHIDGTLWLNISDTYAGKGNQGSYVEPERPIRTQNAPDFGEHLDVYKRQVEATHQIRLFHGKKHNHISISFDFGFFV